MAFPLEGSANAKRLNEKPAKGIARYDLRFWCANKAFGNGNKRFHDAIEANSRSNQRCVAAIKACAGRNNRLLSGCYNLGQFNCFFRLMTQKPIYGPHNPHPRSQMLTELVWEGKYDEYGVAREVDIARLRIARLHPLLLEISHNE
jgi:hypothetical protein